MNLEEIFTGAGLKGARPQEILMSIVIPDFLKKYLTDLVEEFSDVEEIWLLGSRANNSANENSDWDIMIFADHYVLNALKMNVSFKHQDIDLLVVYDGNKFEQPWVSLSRVGTKRTKKGELKQWDFRETENNVAVYSGSKPDVPDGYFINPTQMKMYRIWKDNNWISIASML